MNRKLKRTEWLALVAGVLLVGIFAALVVGFRRTLRAEIRQTIINRQAAVLRPVAQRQLAQQRAEQPDDASVLVAAVLESIQQEDMLAVVVFDSQGKVLQSAPDSLLFAELPLEDFLKLLKGAPLSRYYPDFRLDRAFSGINATQNTAPVLEVLLPLHASGSARILGFAQYFIDARALASELQAIDRRINRQTWATLSLGALLIFAVVIAAYASLKRAHDRLVRAHFELTLAAKASALGQITSHLIHGLQGSVAGLRAVVASHDRALAGPADWDAAAEYTQRMEATIREVVGLLGDSAHHNVYSLSGDELASFVRERGASAAQKKGVTFDVRASVTEPIDSHRGGLLCLIAHNLVQNAVEATTPGSRVGVVLAEQSGRLVLTVADQGPGIPESLRANLFQPGISGRPGGTGLGLAISQLLARQIGGSLSLKSTGPRGTTFELDLPLVPAGDFALQISGESPSGNSP